MSIMKQSTNKYRNDDCYKILIRHVYRLHVRSNHHGKMMHYRLNTSHHVNKHSNTEMFTILFG